MHATSTAYPLRRASLLVVVAALLLSQTLGLLHRVAHAPHASHSMEEVLGSQAHAPHPAHLAHADADGGASHRGAAFHWLDTLFASHDDRACASYDHGLLADALWGAPAPVCALALNAALVPHQSTLPWAAQAAGYLARGPPIPS